jgi:hypothetical protein
VSKRDETSEAQYLYDSYLKGYVSWNELKGAFPNATPVQVPLTETNVTKDTINHLETEEQWNYTSRYDSVKGGFNYNMKLAWLCMLGGVGYAFNALFPTFFTTLGLRKVTKAYSKEWYARYGHLVGYSRPPYLCDVEVWRILNINRSFQENDNELYAD